MAAFRYPLEEIRSRISLAELVGAYVRLRRSGKNLLGLCPFHTEKTPSFTVSEEHQRYRCYGCGENGDIFTFVMKMEGLTFPDAVEQLARRAGVEIQREPTAASDLRQRLREIVSAAAFFFRQQLAGSEKARAYLEQRGVAQDVVERYGLGYAPDSWSALGDHLTRKGHAARDIQAAGLIIPRERSEGYYDRFRDRLIFPIYDLQDRPIGFGGRAFGDEMPKYLNSPESPLFVKNRTLYGLNTARRHISRDEKVIIVEGYFDALTAQVAGFGNTVATMGTALTAEHVSLLSRYTRNAVVAFDSDSAGIAAALRSAAMFEENDFNVRVAELPPGQDPDSLLRSGARDEFARLVNHAIGLAQFRLNKTLAARDLSTEEGRTEALKEATVVIADVASAVERDRLMDQILIYHPSFDIDTVRAKESIRADVERIRARRRRAIRPPEVTSGSQPAARIEARPTRATGVQAAEVYILRAAFEDGDYCERMLREVGADGFVSPAAQNIAAAIEANGADISEIAQAVAGTPAETLLNEILVSRDEPGITEQAFSDCVNRLHTYRKRQKERQLRSLKQRIESGEITRNDEEFAEYWRLVRELHG